MLPKFRARSEINRCKKLDDSSSKAVRSFNGVFGVLHSSSDRISLKTHQLTPSHKFCCCPSFGLDPKSISVRIGRGKKLDNSSSKAVRSKLDWFVYCRVLAIGFHSKLTKCLLPPYCDVAQVLGSI
ncbi:hypothetical protein Pyn_05429 [Prunus yedoensis var. nudiflora]|uniref:Uncharacterized protein n=1 Tax=Prunus yedoensis var. nudiflora TaxID=2094558 RepID=A0A314ZFC1_PRUYE|nr:hypothetical protein Pyn_05429 [Prunus yedoensis var. nudiflora]